jgi:hypothetical protein
VHPAAPHLIFPQFQNDGDEAERALGLWFARILLTKCDELWVFGETISPGMARRSQRGSPGHSDPILYRRLRGGRR